MKKTFTLLCLLFLLSSPVSPQVSSTKQRALALTHVTVIDTTGGPVQRDMTVLIRGGRIAAIGKGNQITLPQDSQVVNATGKFLIPGLWDMSVWFYEKDYFPLFVANGVTGVREMEAYAEHHEVRKQIERGELLGPRIMAIGTRGIEGLTHPYLISVANAAEARRAVVHAQRHGADFIRLGVTGTLSRDPFFALADEAKKRGIPIEGRVPVSVRVEEASNAGLKSIDPLPAVVEGAGILAACSSHEADVLKSWRGALAEFLASDRAGPESEPKPAMLDPVMAGPGFRERMQLALDTCDPPKAEALFAVLRKNHTWVCPTLIARRSGAFFEDPAVASDPRLKYMSSGERNWWNYRSSSSSKTWSPEDILLRKQAYRKQLEIAGSMHRAGVELLAGTTTEEPLFTFPGFSLHDELGLLVQAGLTPLQALQTATLNPARFLGREHDFGAIAPGKFADLVLLDANPLEDIGNTRKIAAVVYRGKLYPRASLDAMLAKIEVLARRKSTYDLVAAAIKEKGVQAAIHQYRELKSTQPDSYDFEDPYALNDLGGDLLGAKQFRDAIQVLELNITAFPDWWWTYDTLGDAYMKAGEQDLAIKSFKKSLELDPAQTRANKVIPTNAPRFCLNS